MSFYRNIGILIDNLQFTTCVSNLLSSHHFQFFLGQLLITGSKIANFVKTGLPL